MTGINWADWGLTEPIQMEPVKGGLINTSLRAEWSSGEVRFVQRLNKRIFPNTDAIEHNLNQVSEHTLAALTVIPIRRQDGCIHSPDGWRVFPWIEASSARLSAQELGELWGNVNAKLLLHPTDWQTVLPNFHSAAVRWNHWQAVQSKVPSEYFALLQSLNYWSAHFLQLESKLLPAVQHHDAKRSNVLNSAVGLRVIDLDTLQPGYLGSDFADLVRSTAALRAEDDPESNSADSEVVQAAWSGYTSTFRLALDHADTLRQMPAYVTWIQALRFATDAACGNGYYQVDYPEHNWVRAKNQLQLLQSFMEIHDRC